MIELRGYIAFPTYDVEDEDHNVTITSQEIIELEGRINEITRDRIEFVTRYNQMELTIIFLADFRKRATGPMDAVRELDALLRPLKGRFDGQFKVHIFGHDLERDETILVQLGKPEIQWS